MNHRVLLLGVLLYGLLWSMLLPTFLAVPPEQTFSNDAASYNAAAVHVAREGFYSLDGVAPYVEREPGYSGFISLVYTLFGIENRLAIYLATALLHLLAVLFFIREMQRVTSPGVASCTFMFLLTFPSLFLAFSIVYREAFTLALMLLLAAAFLWEQRTQRMQAALSMGGLLGAIALTYLPFLFLPLLFGALLWWRRMSWKHVTVVVTIPLLIAGSWGLRNEAAAGMFTLGGGDRIAGNTYMRAQKAANLRPLENFTCLYREYVLRDFRNPHCMTNTIMHEIGARIRRGETTRERALDEAQQLLLRHPWNFLTGSIAEVAEFHFPFFDGTTTYNFIALLAYLLLYIGVPHGIVNIRKYPDLLFLLFLPIYAIIVFALTDATPRYHIPTLFTYFTLSAVGYTRLLRRFSTWKILAS